MAEPETITMYGHGRCPAVRPMKHFFKTADVKSVTVVVMEVPCCQGLPVIVEKGMEASGKKIPYEKIIKIIPMYNEKLQHKNQYVIVFNGKYQNEVVKGDSWGGVLGRRFSTHFKEEEFEIIRGIMKKK